MKLRKMLSIAVAVALSFPAGNVIIASAQDRDHDQLKTQQQLQDKDNRSMRRLSGLNAAAVDCGGESDAV